MYDTLDVTICNFNHSFREICKLRKGVFLKLSNVLLGCTENRYLVELCTVGKKYPYNIRN